MNHPEQIAGVIRVGQKIKLDKMANFGKLVMHVAQRREILGREAYTVEQGDLVDRFASWHLTGKDAHISVTGWSSSNC